MKENGNDGPGDRAAATMTVEEAGRHLGVGRNLAYDLAKRGEIPTIRLGRLLRVPRVALERMLESAGKSA